MFKAVRPDCLGRVTMLAAGRIPFVFVDRLTGLRLLQVPGVTEANACATASPAPGSPVAGSLRRLGVHPAVRDAPPRRGRHAGFDHTDRHLRNPRGPGPGLRDGLRRALSVHEAIDPTPGKKLVYVSYGLRILNYDNNGLAEVGAFIDQGGNNFWGVEVHNISKEQYVLASDRDFGLIIFQPDL